MDLDSSGTKRKNTDNSLQKKRMRVSWKDRYEDLKAGRSSEDDLVETHSPQTYLPQLIRYMLTMENPPDDVRLESHTKYKYAKGLIDERFPECINENGVPNSWCIIAMIILVSEYTSDIKEIYQVLQSSLSPSTVAEVIECFYCVATFLLQFTKHQRKATWNGMHYRLYYVLYSLENERSDEPQDALSCADKDQRSFIRSPSGSTFPMTKEQTKICRHDVFDGEVVKIISFAGTGKTTTLVKYTEQRPHLRFLLVVFNKYMRAGLFDAFWLKQKNILDQISLCKGENKFAQANLVIRTLEKYMASVDKTISTEHVPHKANTKHAPDKVNSMQQKKHYAREAAKVWEKMVNIGNKQVKITHDGYLKMFQLEKPTIDQYDVLLIDEAQDMTPALADVLLSQKRATILVGDPHQQIYGFRGAINALHRVEASTTFHLTQSFRFGSQIAFVANSCLSVLKGESEKTLVGNNTTGTVRGEVVGQRAIIARTNMELLNEAISWCATSDPSQTLAVVGGLESFDFQRIEAISSLIDCQRSSIPDKFIKGFKSVMDLENYADRTNDIQLAWKIKAARKYKNNLPTHVAEIERRCTDIEVADVVFTTAHKSKGLEFDTVRLAEDYLNLDAGAVDEDQDITDEKNLLYVTATRAVKSLILGDCLKAVLKRAGETFVYPVLTTELTSDGMEMRCLTNNAPFTPTALTLVKRPVSRGKAAVYSPEAVTAELPHLSQLYGRTKDCTYEDNDQSSDEDSVVEVEEEESEDSERKSWPEFEDYDHLIDYALEHGYGESDDSSEEAESNSESESEHDYGEETSGANGNCDCCVECEDEEDDEEEDNERTPVNNETCGKNRDSSDEGESSQSVIDLTIEESR